MGSRRKKTLQDSKHAVEVNDQGHHSTHINFLDGNENNVKFNFSDFEDIIRKFSGNETMNIKVWLQDFEQYAETFRWNDMQCYIFCKRSLSAVAKLYIECEAKPRSYHELKTALYTEFKPRMNAAEVHNKLRDRKKKNDESYREYLYQIIDIASQAELDELSVISYVISGINDSCNNKSVLYGAKSISEFKEKLTIYEKIKNDTNKFSAASGGESNKLKVNHKKGGKGKYCYNCGSSEHEFHACPNKQKGPKCFKWETECGAGACSWRYVWSWRALWRALCSSPRAECWSSYTRELTRKQFPNMH